MLLNQPTNHHRRVKNLHYGVMLTGYVIAVIVTVAAACSYSSPTMVIRLVIAGLGAAAAILGLGQPAEQFAKKELLSPVILLGLHPGNDDSCVPAAAGWAITGAAVTHLVMLLVYWRHTRNHMANR